jgi:1-aminocyclopropane-1-carboxylate deaminase
MAAHLVDADRHAPLQRVVFPWLELAGIELAILRLDLIDPIVNGNKPFKLSAYLAKAAAKGSDTLISLGGAHSNHLHALAHAGHHSGLRTVGLLRGHPVSNPTIDDLHRCGMHLHWLGYAGYRARHTQEFWESWLVRYPNAVPIPEGGVSLEGAHGCAALVAMIHRGLSGLGWRNYDQAWISVGTGTTLAGLALAEDPARLIVGALAVPPSHGPAENIENILKLAGCSFSSYKLIDASWGGFARVDELLLSFMHQCEIQSGMLFEPVYTAKLLWALKSAVESGEVPRGSRIVIIHTGGLQGRRGFGLTECLQSRQAE